MKTRTQGLISVLASLALAAGMTAGITPTAYADDNVCDVTIDSDTTPYTDFGDALNSIQSGDTATITLLSDIDYTSGISIDDDTNITLDLNGHTLDVIDDAGSSNALSIGSGASIHLSDPSNGAFNITATDVWGVYMQSASAEVSSIKTVSTDGSDTVGTWMMGNSDLTVYGNVASTAGISLYVFDYSTLFIHGYIVADPVSIGFLDDDYDLSSAVDDPDNPGYLLLTDGFAYLWAKKPIDLSTITVTIPAKAWTGKQIKPTSFTYNGVSYPFTDNTSSATYGTNKNIGKGTVKITGKGMFAGTKTITFQIVPKTNKISKIAAAKKSMKVTWTKVSSTQKVTGYQVHYRVKGKTTWKTKTFSAKYSSATIKSLLKGKKYQVQVRSYKTVSKVMYYSAWSAVKTSAAIK